MDLVPEAATNIASNCRQTWLSSYHCNGGHSVRTDTRGCWWSHHWFSRQQVTTCTSYRSSTQTPCDRPTLQHCFKFIIITDAQSYPVNIIILLSCHKSVVYRHLPSTLSSTQLRLLPEDLAEIESVLSLSSGPRGPVYGLERKVSGVHGRIMKYTLNKLNMAEHLEELCHRY